MGVIGANAEQGTPLTPPTLARRPLRRLAADALVASAVAIALGAGVAVHALQAHLAAELAAGATLNPLARLLAEGSTAATVWPGWVAAGFFALALHRLRTGPAEEPAVRGGKGTESVADLRAGLRQEFRAVRMALVTVAALTLLDAGRGAAVIATRPGVGAVLVTLAEIAGLVVATGILGLWVREFRGLLQRWGAL